jgi:hypothetical protein
LGNLYFEGDNLRLAKMHYELAAEINPIFPNLYFNLGLVLGLMEEKSDRACPISTSRPGRAPLKI